ncbi:MAG: hypothetical protein MUF14_11520 [Hyphomonadaceae bacterium]|nr:hypothetical protein [Hyphomonadaceae bacterium]
MIYIDHFGLAGRGLGGLGLCGLTGTDGLAHLIGQHGPEIHAGGGNFRSGTASPAHGGGSGAIGALG